MKYLLNILILIAVTGFISCDSGDSEVTPNPLEEQKALLINDGKAWIASSTSSVIKDGFDVSGQFSGFSLEFGDGTFSTSNSIPNAWPVSGTWEFSNDNKNSIVRSDGVVMAVNINGNNLMLTFTASGASGGRTSSVEGEFQFSLISQ